MIKFGSSIRLTLVVILFSSSISQNLILAQTPTALGQIGRHCELRDRGIRVHYQLKQTLTPQLSDQEKAAIEKGLHGKVQQGVAKFEGSISIQGLSYRLETFAKNDKARNSLMDDHVLATMTPERAEVFREEAGKVSAFIAAPEPITSAIGPEAALMLRFRYGRKPLTTSDIKAMKKVESKEGSITTLTKEDGDLSHKILFDANFGNFPVRCESTLKGRPYVLVENEDFRLVKGEWLPFRSNIQVLDQKSGLPNSIEEYRITSYEIGDLPESEFSIALPKGTELYDTRKDTLKIVK